MLRQRAPVRAIDQAGDHASAVLACDVLVARVLASGASLAGAQEAPRDPGVVVVLLGLEGPRYLSFRAAVRAARGPSIVLYERKTIQRGEALAAAERAELNYEAAANHLAAELGDQERRGLGGAAGG